MHDVEMTDRSQVGIISETKHKLDHEKGHKVPPAEDDIGRSEAIKVDASGNVLRPTPSDSPLDPLNWPLWKKRE